jgi:hypothetical protein
MSLQPPLSQARAAAQHRSLPFLFQSPVPSSVSLAVVEALPEFRPVQALFLSVFG